MEILLISLFIIGYAAIAFEHSIKVDKAASALILGVLIWTVVILAGYTLIPDDQLGLRVYLDKLLIENKLDPSLSITDFKHQYIEYGLVEYLGEVSQILFFLIGAMAIVEVIDIHKGFQFITDRIKTTNAVKLLWIISVLTFFLSAILDNLTTTIVMVSLIRKLIEDQHKRWFYAGIIVIAANSGGAWSPIGDVTTTMLWIDGQITESNIVLELILPSIIALLIPLFILSFTLKGDLKRPKIADIPTLQHKPIDITQKESFLVLITGVAGLIFVPAFKLITHLPPFMGMMLSLGGLWIVTEVLHKKKEQGHYLSVISGLRKVDMASVLFFLGILLAIGGLQITGLLRHLATFLQDNIADLNILNIIIGVLSAIVDNVPLVAAAQAMFNVETTGPFATDGTFWNMLAYCAGTGGSILIIGSAAGVAAMGIEKISFGWYLKHISWLALLGYLAGAITYILIQ
ncbi:MAG TPA: sodium:proton antiporter NhaD [Bacteroidia bacterium]